MTGPWTRPEERARDELRAATLLLDAGLRAQAVSRAWFAALHAAAAALAATGATPSSPSAVVSTFGGAVEGNGLDPRTGRALRRLFEDHKDVDYALAVPTARHAERALADAHRFVEDTLRWMEGRARDPTSSAGS